MRPHRQPFSVRRTSPPSQSDDVFLDGYGKKMLLLVGGGITGFIALINVISMYGAMFVFLLFGLQRAFNLGREIQLLVFAFESALAVLQQPLLALRDTRLVDLLVELVHLQLELVIGHTAEIFAVGQLLDNLLSKCALCQIVFVKWQR